LKATLITLLSLQINALKFAAGHVTVVQPVCINKVFGYKQAQHYSRIHSWVQFGGGRVPPTFSDGGA